MVHSFESVDDLKEELGIQSLQAQALFKLILELNSKGLPTVLSVKLSECRSIAVRNVCVALNILILIVSWFSFLIV
jgi:hypothetical protein